MIYDIKCSGLFFVCCEQKLENIEMNRFIKGGLIELRRLGPRQALLSALGKIWRWVWSLMPGAHGPTRVRLAYFARQMLGSPPQPDYNPSDRLRHWMAKHATPSKEASAAISARIVQMRSPVRFTVVLDARHATAAEVELTFGSVIKQFYPHFSLQVLGKPYNTIAGPQERPEDLVLWLVPGDLLATTALYDIAVAAEDHRDAAIIYGDECHGDADDMQPWLKSKFDIDLLYGIDLFGHAVAYRRDLLDRINGRTTVADNRHTLALRAADAAGVLRIHHVPKVLCGRIGNAFLSDPMASRTAVAAMLATRGIFAKTISAPLLPGASRVVWPLPSPPPLVSVIVPTRDQAALLAGCVGGVMERTNYQALEIIIVDNGSELGETHVLFKNLQRDPRVRILSAPGPFNYSRLNNLAASEASGDVLLLLNNDVSVIDGSWLTELVSQALRPDVGAVGAKLLYPDGTLQHGGVVVDIHSVATHYQTGAMREDPGKFGSLALVREVAAVTGACLALRRNVFEAVGGLDEINLPVAYNDIDLCLRIRQAGYRILWTPFAQLYHLESASRGKDTSGENANRLAAESLLMRQRWRTTLLQDPIQSTGLPPPPSS